VFLFQFRAESFIESLNSQENSSVQEKRSQNYKPEMKTSPNTDRENMKRHAETIFVA